MERLQAQTKTHPFFEAELALNMDTSGRESEEPQKFIRVMAQYNESLSSFLVHVPLKFVGQPICESTPPTRSGHMGAPAPHFIIREVLFEGLKFHPYFSIYYSIIRSQYSGISPREARASWVYSWYKIAVFLSFS